MEPKRLLSIAELVKYAAAIKRPRNALRIFAGSDIHCGHAVGLTPPLFQHRVETCTWIDTHHRDKLAAVTAECWDAFATLTAVLKPFDAALWLGDMVDGWINLPELLEPSRKEQAKIAVVVDRQVQAPVVRMVYGTAAHVSKTRREEAEDWEEDVRDGIRACGADVKIGSHEWPTFEGVVFDMKHDPGGSSQYEHLRHRPLAVQRMQNALWADVGYQPKADIFLRGHVHYTVNCGVPGGYQAYTLPALQAMGTRYGSRKCSGIVDWGFFVWDIEPNGATHFYPFVPYLPSQAAHAEDLTQLCRITRRQKRS